MCIFSFANAQKSGKVLEYNTIIRVEKGSLIEEKSYYFEVDDKQSDWMSDIKIPYSQSSKIDIVEACSINSAGQVVRKLSKKEIVTRSDISENSFYENDMAKEFSLRNNEYPYFIRYTYKKTTNKYIRLALWTPLLYNELPTAKASLKVEVPLDFKIRISNSGDFTFKKDTAEGKLFLSWEALDTKPVRKEILAPPDEELYPVVLIVPEKFTYVVQGKLDSWTSIGIWQEQINKGLDSLPILEKIKITDLLKGITNKMEKMKKLYHYMQDNTHYVSVNIDIGGLQPYPASYVCNNKYGDCKALTIYMKALLKFAGIESYYVCVNAGKNAKRIDKDFPSFQFNHVILCVPDGNDTIWLENTSEILPFGYLGPFTQNRYALVVNGSQSKLVRTPAMKPDDFLVRSAYIIRPEKSGIAVLHLEKDLKGDDFIRWLAVSSESSEDTRKEAVSNELTTKNEVIRYEVVHPDRDGHSMKLTADLSVNNAFRQIGNSLVLNLSTVRINPFEKPGDRKYPVRINYPVNQVDSIIVEIPFIDDYNVELPGTVSIDTKFGSFHASFTRESGELKIIRRFVIPVNDISINEYDSFFAFLESVNKSIKKSSIILNNKL
jgi:hypothetical protein